MPARRLCLIILTCCFWPLLAQDIGAAQENGAAQLNDRTFWFGNSFPGGRGAAARWMMQGVDDLAVAGDRVYPIVAWDEHGGEANIYSTAGQFVLRPEGWHSWGWRGGSAVAVDAGYVYYSMGHDPHDGGGEDFGGVARYTREGKPAPFTAAKMGHRLAVNADHAHMPTGLAVSDSELFVSDPLGNRIVVFATADLHQVREFAFPHPGRIAIDSTADHALWVIDTDANTVRRLDRDGRDLGTRITDCLKPVALAITPEGDLLVADGHPIRQRIQRYHVPSGIHIADADFGGPIYQGATPGLVRPGRFFRINGIACGSDGSLYVGCWDYGGKIWKFDANRQFVWALAGTEFVNCADADPDDDTSIYSAGHRYEIDYTKPPGQNWRDAAITLDPVRYSDDPRVHDSRMAMRMLRIGGHKIMSGKFQMDSRLCLWRFDGQIAVPAAIFCGEERPKSDLWPPGRPDGPWLWIDSVGDGRFRPQDFLPCPRGSQAVMVDVRGDIVVNTGGWDAPSGAITIIPCIGVNALGVPQWDLANMRSTPIPTAGGIRQLSKLSYDPLNDRMYIGAWTTDHPFPGGGWEQMNCGAVLLRFDNWTKQPTLEWRSSIIPPEGMVAISKAPKAWSFQTDYAFIAYTWRPSSEAVDVYRLSDGKRIGRLLPTAEIGDTTGWIDMNDAVQSHRRADGAYVVFIEEDSMAKGVYWLWKP